MAQHSIVRHPADGLAPTQTQTQTQPANGQSRPLQSIHVGTLRLRGEPRQRPGVRWAADVVDNSNMNKKKSKVCCIYHKPRSVDESSSESSSSSSESDSDSEPDNSTARMGGKGTAKRKQKHDCDHDHDHAEDSNTPNDNENTRDQDVSHQNRQTVASVRRRSPNAYEKMKTYKSGGSRTKTMTETPT